MSEVVLFDPSGVADTTDLNSLSQWEKHNTEVAGDLRVVSGSILAPASGGDECTSRLTASHNSDHYSEVVLGGTKNGSYVGVIAGAQAPGQENFFLLTADFSSEGSALMRFAKKVDGSYTAFGGATLSFFEGSILRIIRAGDTIAFHVDGAEHFVADNSANPGELSGGSPGILIEEGSSIEVLEVRSGNVLSTSNTVSRTATQFPDQNSATYDSVSVPMNDDLGNPNFSTTGTFTRFRAVNLPPGVTVNESTGVMSGTISAGAEGTYSVHIWAEDDQGWQRGDLFDWTVTTGTAPSDTTAPTFDTAPNVTATTEIGHTISFETDEGGTVYGVRLPNGADAPDSDQVIAGTDASDSAAPEVKSVAVTGGVSNSLTFSTGSASTAYDYYIVAEDDEGTPNLQASPTLVEATTAAAQVPGISAITVQKDGTAVQAADWAINITLVSGGTEVYSGSSITSDASGVISAINTSSGSVGDAVRVEGYSDSNNYGFVFTQNLEDNA